MGLLRDSRLRLIDQARGQTMNTADARASNVDAYAYICLYMYIMLQSFIYSYSMDPYKVSVTYGYRNRQQTAQ
jgi:hypothetical protein